MTRSIVTWLLAMSTCAACTPATTRMLATLAGAQYEDTGTQAGLRLGYFPKHKGGGDLSTGVYTREDDDLVVNTTMPLVLRRTYNSGDTFPRQFGMNVTHAGELWIHGDGDPNVPWGELILPTGTRIRFTRISPGLGKEGAVLRHVGVTEFNEALLRWNGADWEMQFRDGAVAIFGGKLCAILERRDAAGHRIVYVREASGRLARMESEDQSIALEYDDSDRIVRAYTTSGDEVQYSYDERGRLKHVTGSDGVVRSYGYDEHDKLIEVREPGRLLYNWFDDEGRWFRQVVMRSEDDDDPYVADAEYVVKDGSIVESHFDEGAGLVVERYNGTHHLIYEALDANGAAPIVFVYDRDPASNIVTRTTLSCVGRFGSVFRKVPLTSPLDEGTKEELIRENCVRRP
jgi:YD repeat-containing protein